MMFKLDGSESLSLKLYRSLRAAILGGTLTPGARLPSTRALATELGLSRNTILRTYDQLLSEGYAVGRHGSGTYVPSELPDAAPPVATVPGPLRPPAAAGPPLPRLSRFGEKIRRWDVTWAASGSPVAVDFRYGRPRLDFPLATWRRLLGRRLRTTTMRDLDYGSPAGCPELRSEVAGYLQRARGVVCTPDQVVIVRGSQQALDLTARVLLNPGDSVLLEEPHYHAARAVFLAAGARVLTVAVGEDGMDISALDSRAKRIRAAYVTPSHQFPSGAIMSLANRLALLAWAERTRAHVIEDDYDSEYRYTGRPIESLQGLDRNGRVIYLGTFSKLLFPALRIAYAVVPSPLLRTFTNAKALSDTGGTSLEQLALADFIREGHFERHIRRSRVKNAARRAAMLEALDRHLHGRIEVMGANAGLNVLVWLNDVPISREGSLHRQIEAAGVGVYPVSPFYLRPPERVGFLLGYASLTREQIEDGVRLLRTALGRVRKK